MKLPAFLLTIFAAATLSARAENSPIRLTVELISKTEAKVDKGKVSPDKTQVRSLKIQLDNNSAQAFEALSVKYWFLGHALTEHDVKPLAEGERKASLNPRGREMVESEVVSKKFTEAHSEMKGKTATKVPASGEKISGYAVRVLNDGKVLAEYYSEPSYKTLIKDGDQPSVSPTAAKPGAKPAAK